MRVALTGHRPQRLGLPEDVCDSAWDKLETWLMKKLVKLHKESDELVGYCGMAFCLAIYCLQLKMLKVILNYRVFFHVKVIIHPINITRQSKNRRTNGLNCQMNFVKAVIM